MSYLYCKQCEDTGTVGTKGRTCPVCQGHSPQLGAYDNDPRAERFWIIASIVIMAFVGFAIGAQF